MPDRSRLKITVLNVENAPIANATVSYRGSANRTNPQGTVEIVVEFPAELQVSADGLESQRRQITEDDDTDAHRFILGSRGLPWIMQRKVKVPFKGVPNTIAIVLKDIPEPIEDPNQPGDRPPQLPEQTQAIYRRLLRDNPLPAANDPLLLKGVLIRRLSTDANEVIDNEISRLSQDSAVQTVGRAVRLTESNCTLLTPKVVARLKPGLTPNQISALGDRHNLRFREFLIERLNIALFDYDKVAGYNLLNDANRLATETAVIYSEPDSYATTEEHSAASLGVEPANYLFQNQWDFKLIGLPHAWRALRELDSGLTFGSPKIKVAVVDTVFPEDVISKHPSFTGKTVTLIPNPMPGPSNTHGLACASVVAGVTHDSKVEGAAGVAGNCDLVLAACQSKYADDVKFLDTLSASADIVSCSVTLDYLANLARKDVFLTLKEKRGKKGVLFFQAAGNENKQFDLNSPLYDCANSTICLISASTLTSFSQPALRTETKTDYTNYSDQMFCCAPSSPAIKTNRTPAPANKDGGVIVATDPSASKSTNPSASNKSTYFAPATGKTTLDKGDVYALRDSSGQLILQPNNSAGKNNLNKEYGPPAYQHNFAGTSYSTPVVAGVAALMLSANQSLDYNQMRTIIQQTAVKIGNLPKNQTDPDRHYGYGRIDANRAVRYAAAIVEVPTQQLTFDSRTTQTKIISFTVQSHWVSTFLITVPEQSPFSLSQTILHLPPPADRSDPDPSKNATLSFAVTCSPDRHGTSTANLSHELTLHHPFSDRTWTIPLAVRQVHPIPIQHRNIFTNCVFRITVNFRKLLRYFLNRD